MHEFEYDAVNQLVGATLKDSSSQVIVKQFAFGYDLAGNRNIEQIDFGISTATYNPLNQFTEQQGGGLLRFAGRLDKLGTVTVGGSMAAMDSRTTNFVGYVEAALGTNIVVVVATDFSGNSRTNNYQVVVTNTTVAKTLSYDANGNLSTVVSALWTNTYEWDGENRLVAINVGTNRSEFTYDGLNRRVRGIEKVNGSITSDKRFLWCETELCEERDSGSGAVSKRFFSRGVQSIGTNLFYTSDHLGSIRDLTDGSGNIHAQYSYDRLTPEQAVTLFRDLGRKIDSFRPTIWPGVTLVLVGCVLLSWKRSIGCPISDPLPRAEPGAAPNGGPATVLGNSGATKGPPSVS